MLYYMLYYYKNINVCLSVMLYSLCQTDVG
jgi:hypothetical protein